MRTSPQQASTASGSTSPLLEAMAAFSDEVFEATQRLLKAQQQMTRAVLGCAGQEEERAGQHDRDDQPTDEKPAEVDEAEEEPVDEAEEVPVDEADDEVDDEPVDEAEEVPVGEADDEVDDEPVDEAEEVPVDEADNEVDDEVDDQPVDSQIGRNRVPARAKSRAPAAAKRSTRGRQRSA